MECLSTIIGFSFTPWAAKGRSPSCASRLAASDLPRLVNRPPADAGRSHYDALHIPFTDEDSLAGSNVQGVFFIQLIRNNQYSLQRWLPLRLAGLRCSAANQGRLEGVAR